MKYVGKFFDTLIDRIVSVIGAIVFSQLPQLIMQYLRVLEGAMAEAKKNLSIAKEKAAEVGLTLEEFVNAHIRNPDPIFQKSGEVYKEAMLRYEDYQSSYMALSEASIWTRPFVFLSNMDSSLITAMKFTPGLPLTMEGAIYALCGILTALAIYHGIVKQPFRLLNRDKKKKLPKAKKQPIES